MTVREKILETIHANKPAYQPIPPVDWSVSSTNVAETFMNTLKGIGATVHVIKDTLQIKHDVLAAHGDQKRIVNRVESLDWKNADEVKFETAVQLEKIEVAIIEGQLGVAENGAIWISEEVMGHRALPYICQHLILVLDITKIVPTMHQAYASVEVNENGFGVFIAGPSKTADIEQSLVIGAHGARSLVVYLI